MYQLVIASDNAGKILEIRSLIEEIELLSLSDIGFKDKIAEPYLTFEENALAKASAIYGFCGKNVFADDSGLCINSLNGEPGVDSAHYCGKRDDDLNTQKVLEALSGVDDRSAFYKAVICLIWDGEVYYFEGICEGAITHQRIGEGGFGYDPVFVPAGYDKTFGELPLDEKNKISHRAKAVTKMVAFLKELRG